MVETAQGDKMKPSNCFFFSYPPPSRLGLKKWCE